MTIVFPFSHVDINLAVPIAKWMRELGPYPRHDALLVYSQELSSEQRESVAVEFRNMGFRIPARAMVAPVQVQSWPEAPNALFKAAAEMILNSPDMHRPWYFMEPDCTPMRKGWADELADEYNQNVQLPFLGMVQASYVRNNVNGQLTETGKHLVGTAIYPYSTRNYIPSTVGREAFDHALSRKISHRWRNSRLMQHNWSTGNYRMENDTIVCDQVNLRVTQSGNPLNANVNPSVAVVHGCKDLSLLALLQANKNVGHAKVLTVETENHAIETHIPSKPSPKWRAKRRKMSVK